MTRRVVLLCGPPGAGKTTAARESGLTLYDRDDAHWTGEKHFRAALRELGQDPNARAVVIRSGATSTARASAAHLIRATHTYLFLADTDELKRRVRERRRADMVATIAAIDLWLRKFDRDDAVRDFPGWDQLTRLDTGGLGEEMPAWW